jgi:hypothetical protein
VILESSPANEQEESVRIFEAMVEFVHDVSGRSRNNGLCRSKCLLELSSSTRLHLKNGHLENHQRSIPRAVERPAVARAPARLDSGRGRGKKCPSWVILFSPQREHTDVMDHMLKAMKG